MTIIPDEELRCLCSEIVDAERTVEQWAAAESDDMFQSASYSGGFDADENEFCFSLYRDGTEYWFQVSYAEVHQIAEGQRVSINAREAE